MKTFAKLRTRLAASPAAELLLGTAHQAHPTDITAPLEVRFAGQTILAIHVALEKAATVRVAFKPGELPRLTAIHNIKQRSSPEFGDVLRSEANAAGAHWAVIVLAAGWQAVLGQRAARPDPTDARGRAAFARHKLMMETPEVVVPRAQADRVYTAIDHPVLDRSVVFSVRRREVEDLLAQVRKCGLEIAAVRIGVASQLEAWLATQGEAGMTRDLLLTDGLSALLLNTEQGDFVAPRGAVESEHPRQAVQRPSAVEEDIARFVAANAGRSITYLGPEELCVAVKKAAPEAEIVRPPAHPAHDTQQVALAAAVQHDLNIDAREVRPALPRAWRRVVVGAGVAALVLSLVTGVNTYYAVRVGYDCYQIERTAANRQAESNRDTAALAEVAADFANASALRNWIGANVHAQPLCYHLLRDIPANAAIDKLLVELRDRQITLTFVILGDQDTQLAAHRAIEQAIKDLHYKIGGEELPANAAGASRAVQYRLHLIAPDAAEGVAP